MLQLQPLVQVLVAATKTSISCAAFYVRHNSFFYALVLIFALNDV